MKKKLVSMVSLILIACMILGGLNVMALEIWITIDIASALFFGEYEPPKKPTDN